MTSRFFDSWQEVLETLRHNKMRTALTALSVAWGIFMLVILLAAGTGLKNAALNDFQDDAVNSIYIRARRTSVPYKGRGPGRDVRLYNADYEALKQNVPHIDKISGRFHLRGSFAVSYHNRTAQFEIRGVHPDQAYLEKTELVSGRFLNNDDLERKRKVAAIGVDVAKFLLEEEEPLGKFINIRGAYYQVVGVFTRPGQQGEVATIFLPLTTTQLLYGGTDRLHSISLTVDAEDLETSHKVEAQVKDLLKQRHEIAPHDERALSVFNNLVMYRKIADIFDWLTIFVWVVGLGTLLAGIVGVSNIMLISVKERTKEIGLRKALGATPFNIVNMIMREALLITITSGYLGLLAALLLVELVSAQLPDNKYVRDPSVDLTAAIAATILVIMAGALAGFFPARSAAKVSPIVALRDG